MHIPEELFIEQLAIEKEYKSLAEVAKRHNLTKDKERGDASSIPVGTALMKHKIRAVAEGVKSILNDLNKPKRGVRPAYAVILQDCQSLYTQEEQDELVTLLAYIPFMVTIDSLMANERILNNITGRITKVLHDEMKYRAFCQARPDEVLSVETGLKVRNDFHYKDYYLKHCLASLNFTWKEWDGADAKRLAAKLVELLIDLTGYFELTQGKNHKGNLMTEIIPTQAFLEMWQKNEEVLVSKAFRYTPTIIPPRPWDTVYTGGYYGDLVSEVSLLRRVSFAPNAPSSFHRDYAKKLAQLELKQVREAVNQIQNTPWKINQKVLEIAKWSADKNKELGGMPSFEELPELGRIEDDLPQEILEAHKRALTDRRRREHRRKSKALRVLATLSVAKRFAGYERIYFPHNLDFRGRVYPIPSFSPQGDDLTKGLIKLADTPPIQEESDIDWLMIHGANLAGVDKVSFSDRKQWVRDNEERILAVAEEPKSDFWWSDMDSPYQFLAFCFEWKRLNDYILAHGTPKGFITGVCIAFDGTCSGLQHYSAILRDEIGAAAVNLIPADKPNDIYARVADLVNQELEKDAKEGTPDTTEEREDGSTKTLLGTRTLARQWLTFGVNRSVTKRSVMTLPYGSRAYGFKEQLMEDIVEPAVLEGHGAMFTSPYVASKYLADLIWEANQKVVVKAVEGMDWLQKINRKVVQKGQPITWVTPMGLPIQQAYMEYEIRDVRIRMLGKRMTMYNATPKGKIAKKEQGSGIAPNFIHSMDAAHLQLTTLNSSEKGIRHFAMIHDSYGTCAAQAGLLFQVVRESFVQMYSDHDVFENFLQDMQCYVSPRTKLPVPPEKGTLDLEAVRVSPYAFA